MSHLIHRVNQSVKQVWYADDATATGSMETLRTWWDDLVSYDPQYGYHVNASKTWLITKGEHHAEAAALFQDTSVNITTDGKPNLGAALGTNNYVDDFVQNKVLSWCKDLELLSTIAETLPHAAYAAFTKGMISKWSYIPYENDPKYQHPPAAPRGYDSLTLHPFINWKSST